MSSINKLREVKKINEFFSTLKAEDFTKNKDSESAYSYSKNELFNNPINHHAISQNVQSKNNPINSPFDTFRHMHGQNTQQGQNTQDGQHQHSYNYNMNGQHTHESLNSEVKDIITTSKTFMLKEINFALVLVAAFAWHDSIKYYIARYIKFNRGSPYYYLFYAIIVSLITILVITLTNRFLKDKDKQAL